MTLTRKQPNSPIKEITIANNFCCPIDAWEDEISFLVDSLGSAEECRVLADMLNATADAWELSDVADFMGKWAEEHGVEEPNVTFSANPEGFNEVVLSDEVHEAVRQTIRNLIDKGEL